MSFKSGFESRETNYQYPTNVAHEELLTSESRSCIYYL